MRDKDVDRVRRLLDDSSRRARLGGLVPNALYTYTRRRSPSVLKRFVEPAQTLRGDNDLLYLDAAKFTHLVSQAKDELKVGGSVPRDSDVEHLLLFGYAYALVQTSQADVILNSLRALGPGVGAWLGDLADGSVFGEEGNPAESDRDAGTVRDDESAIVAEDTAPAPARSGPDAERAAVEFVAPCLTEALATVATVVGRLDTYALAASERVLAYDGSPGRDGALTSLIADARRDRDFIESAVRPFARCPSDCPGTTLGCAKIRTMSSVGPIAVRDVAGLAKGVAEMQQNRLTLKRQIALDVAELGQLFADVGASTEMVESEDDSLRGVAISHAETRRRLDATRVRHGLRLEEERERVRQRATALAGLANDTERTTRLGRIQDDVRGASYFQTVAEIARQVETLFEEWQPRRSAQEIAWEMVQTGPVNAGDTIALAAALSDRPMLAASLLWLYQSTTPSHAKERDFWSAWLSTLAALSKERAGAATVVEALLHESRMLEAAPSSIAENARQAFAVVVIAAARLSPRLLALAEHLDAVVTIDVSYLPTLGQVARLLAKRAGTVIVDVGTRDPRDEAKRRIDAAVESSLQKLIAKARQPTMKAKFERIREALRRAWSEIQDSPRANVDGSWKPVEAALEAIDHSFFEKQAGDEVERIRTAVLAFTNIGAPPPGRPHEIVWNLIERDLTELRRRSGLPDIVDLAANLLRAEPFTGSDFAQLILKDAVIARWAPRLLSSVADDVDWVPSDNHLRAFLGELATPVMADEARDLLVRAGCLDAVAALAPDASIDVELGATELRKRATEFLGRPDARGRETLELALHRGRWAHVRRILDDYDNHVAQTERAVYDEMKAQLRSRHRRLHELEERVAEEPHEEEWRRRFGEALSRVSQRVMHTMAPERTAAEKRAALLWIDHALDVARDTLDLEPTDVGALESVVAEFSESRPAIVRGDGEELDLLRAETRRDARQDFWQRLVEFGKAYSASNVASGQPLLRSFAKLVGCYADESDPHKRFSYKKLARTEWFAADTSFHKPGGRCFEAPIRLHLLAAERRRGDDDVALLRSHIEEPRDSSLHHVVLLGDDSGAPRQGLASALGAATVTLLERASLKRIAEAPFPGGPLRQAMRRSVSVETTSPFKSEGYVSEDRNICVRRSGLADRLTDGRCWAVWGGRRSGKTSLLHEVVRRFKERREKYRPAYVSLEALAGTSLTGLDVGVAQAIGHALGWEELSCDVGGFIRRLETECRSTPICLVVDEIDAYVKPHVDARNTEFRILRALRGLSNQNQGQLACVFAGFKFLFRVMKLERYNDDPSYPWQNWLESAPAVAWLTQDETAAVLREGFEEMLGMELEPTVPLLIHKYTAGHPASVQHFANCLLRDIASSVKSDLGRRVTADDVNRTFTAPRARDGQEPFIRFVESTLAMNLGDLERIIVYVMAAESLRRVDDRSWIDRSSVQKDVDYYFHGLRCPAPEDYTRAFRYLEMTGMLEAEARRVKMKFPSYADILRRLEEADHHQIMTLVTEYDEAR